MRRIRAFCAFGGCRCPGRLGAYLSPRETPHNPAPSVRHGDCMKTILLIDSDARRRQLYARILTRRGYAVDHASSAADAMARCAERAFDLFVVDSELDDTSGVGFLTTTAGERGEGKVILLVDLLPARLPAVRPADARAGRLVGAAQAHRPAGVRRAGRQPAQRPRTRHPGRRRHRRARGRPVARRLHRGAARRTRGALRAGARRPARARRRRGTPPGAPGRPTHPERVEPPRLLRDWPVGQRPGAGPRPRRAGRRRRALPAPGGRWTPP